MGFVDAQQAVYFPSGCWAPVPLRQETRDPAPSWKMQQDHPRIRYDFIYASLCATHAPARNFVRQFPSRALLGR